MIKPAEKEPKKKDVQATKRQSVKDLANKLKLGPHDGPPMIRKKGGMLQGTGTLVYCFKNNGAHNYTCIYGMNLQLVANSKISNFSTNMLLQFTRYNYLHLDNLNKLFTKIIMNTFLMPCFLEVFNPPDIVCECRRRAGEA